jgi:hypothetical protein
MAGLDDNHHHQARCEDHHDRSMAGLDDNHHHQARREDDNDRLARLDNKQGSGTSCFDMGVLGSSSSPKLSEACPCRFHLGVLGSSSSSQFS